MAAEVHTAPEPAAGGSRLLLAGALGALVALTLGIYGNVHDPASDLSITLGFKDTITMKVWLASASLLFALVQITSALWMYGRLPLGAAPGWIGGLHRISGRLAFLFSLPVAYHCLYQLAFQDTTTRVLAHSILGCLVYGAFATKVTIVRSHNLPGIALPIAGGLMFALLVGAWLTSGLWFISENGFPSP
jgi:Family of unknown function (DUF6529)